MNKRFGCIRIFAAALFLSIWASLAAAPSPSPFALDPIGDSVLFGGGVALYGGSLYFQSIKPAPNPAAVDAASIPFFDRAYPANPSSTVSTVGDGLSIALAILPLGLLPGRSVGDILTLGVIYGETLELAYSVDALLKSTIVRYRPYAYSTSTPPDFSVADIAASFPSANSSLAFSAAVFAGYVFDALYPDSSLRPWIWAGGLGAATAVSTLLVAGGDHFLSDALAGAAIGAASGFLVPLLHKKFRTIQAGAGSAVSSLKLEPELGGIALRLRL